MQTTSPSSTSPKASVQTLFDSLALEHVRERESQFSFRSQKRIALELLSAGKGNLLEAGCGPAVMPPDLVPMGLNVHGMDVAGEMVRRARERMKGHPLEQRCHFEVGDVERLRYASDSFNAVLCMGVLEYLPRYGRALAEISRVLAPGAVAVIMLPNRASTYHVARSGYEALRTLDRRLRGRDAALDVAHNRCVPWKLDRDLAEAGLRKVESRACNFVFFPLQELLPRTSESLNRALMPLARSAVAPILGAQYIVKAEKTVWRCASSG